MHDRLEEARSGERNLLLPAGRKYCIFLGFFSIGSCASESGQNTFIPVYHSSSAGVPSMRKATSNEVSSDSVDEFETEPCFLQNQLIGT